MAADTTPDPLLPRIECVFYAVFDVNKGPKVVYQVPEGLIGVPLPLPTSSVSPSHTSNGLTPFPRIHAHASSSTLSPSSDRNPDTSRSSSSISPGFPPGTRHRSIRYTQTQPDTPLERASDSDTPGQPPSTPPSKAPSLKLSASPRTPLTGTHRTRTHRSLSTHKTLFNFDAVSRYVIPQSFLCNRLLTFATASHRLIGFPVELYGERYERNYFRYNLCFVFERNADLSCYEPLVRKISRVLTACEEESSFLSCPASSPAIYTILERLYEDLNATSETSIFINRFNSIELKLFPFYPNPPPLHDWQVPVALIDLEKHVEPNWDLTMAAVCKHIDGANHVSRIASLADCDIDFARKAISHLLYYQVVTMVDIFQFSNIYTLKKSIQWLSDEPSVRDGCGPYVAKSDAEPPEWTKLLHLYSRLKPGITVFEWMQENAVHKLNIDPRRFTTFGVIKGFLRRVHRFPILLKQTTPGKFSTGSVSVSEREAKRSPSRMRRKSIVAASAAAAAPLNTPSSTSSASPLLGQQDPRARASPHSSEGRGSASASSSSKTTSVIMTTAATTTTVTGIGRRASEAERHVEQFRREVDRTGGVIPAGIGIGMGLNIGVGPGGVSIQRGSRSSPNDAVQGLPGQGPGQGFSQSTIYIPPTATTVTYEERIGLPRRNSSQYPYSNTQGSGLTTSRMSMLSQPTFSQSQMNLDASTSTSDPVSILGISGGRIRPSRSPSSQSNPGVPISPYPIDLPELLDGDHHTDELGVRFGAGWPLLAEYLVAIGGGSGEGNDFGKVKIIYR